MFIAQVAKMKQLCWRWAFTPEPSTIVREAVIVEHPASAAWWTEQAGTVREMSRDFLGLQIYSDDTTLNSKPSPFAYPGVPGARERLVRPVQAFPLPCQHCCVHATRSSSRAA